MTALTDQQILDMIERRPEWVDNQLVFYDRDVRFICAAIAVRAQRHPQPDYESVTYGFVPIKLGAVGADYGWPGAVPAIQDRLKSLLIGAPIDFLEGYHV